jgi:hypothetical protein
MTFLALLSRKGTSCLEDARPMTNSEQASMERATADLDAELDTLLSNKAPKFNIPAKRRKRLFA